MLQSHGRAFTGNVANPITATRIDIGMSMQSLAKRLGLSKQYVSRAEQGTYTSLNPSLIAWVAETANIPKGEVCRRYNAFQAATRFATKEEVNPEKLIRHESDGRPGHQIFEQWRSSYWSSVISFSNAFCIHPETIKTYEEGIRPTMPDPIRKTLSQVGLLDENWDDDPRTTKRCTPL